MLLVEESVFHLLNLSYKSAEPFMHSFIHSEQIDEWAYQKTDQI